MAFMPDGKQLIYSCGDSETSQIFLHPLDGSGPSREINSIRLNDNRYASVRAPLPDGRLILSLGVGASETETWLVDPSTDPPGRVKLLDGAPSAWPSPDGKWLSHISPVSGTFELFVRRLRSDGTLGPAIPVPTERLWRYWWAPGLDASGRPQLRCVDRAGVGMTISVGADGLSSPVAMPWNETVLRRGLRGFTEMDDGRVMVVLKAEEERQPTSARVVTGFFEELRQKTGG